MRAAIKLFTTRRERRLLRMQLKQNVLRVDDEDKHQLEIKLKDQSLLDLQKLHRDSSGFESTDNEQYLTEMHERISKGTL